MGKLIDVDTAIRAAVEYIEDWNRAPSMYHRRKLTEKFMALKPVDAVPVVHGRWIRVYSRPGVFKYLGWTCDQCGQRTGNEYAPQWYKFCPNCGARMDGKGNGND